MLIKGGIAKSLVDDARAFAQLQRVRLKKANEALADTKMSAPFDAYVSRRYVDNYVKTRVGDNIVRLNDLHQLLVVISIPEQMLSTVISDEKADLIAVFDFIPGKTFPLSYKENRGDALRPAYQITARSAWLGGVALTHFTCQPVQSLRVEGQSAFQAEFPVPAVLGLFPAQRIDAAIWTR